MASQKDVRTKLVGMAGSLQLDGRLVLSNEQKATLSNFPAFLLSSQPLQLALSLIPLLLPLLLFKTVIVTYSQAGGRKENEEIAK